MTKEEAFFQVSQEPKSGKISLLGVDEPVSKLTGRGHLGRNGLLVELRTEGVSHSTFRLQWLMYKNGKREKKSV